MLTENKDNEPASGNSTTLNAMPTAFDSSSVNGFQGDPSRTVELSDFLEMNPHDLGSVAFLKAFALNLLEVAKEEEKDEEKKEEEGKEKNSSSGSAITPPLPNRPAAVVTTRIQVSNTRVPKKPQCRAIIPKIKNLKADTQALLQAMQRAPPFVRCGQKAAAWLKVANLCRFEPDLTHVTGALCEARYREARKEYEDLQKKALFESGSSSFDQDLLVEDIIASEDEFNSMERERIESEANTVIAVDAFQSVGIDIRDQATEEYPHRTMDSRRIRSEESQDPIVLSGAEPNDNGGVQIIQRRHRKRRKIHQNTKDTEVLLEAAKLF
ncbi:hypothetical protein FBU30_004196 [Linnemannia zychae]|nr:hypothetical protein FBU30_004196 [Linnemannia zychae]